MRTSSSREEIVQQGRGRIADTGSPTVVARRMCVRHGDVGKRTVDAALSIRWRDR